MRHVIRVFGLAVVRGVVAQAYSLKDTFKGRDFFSWTWETSDDPTHGHVNYIDKLSAESSNLSYGMAVFPHYLCYSSYPLHFLILASDNTFVMRVDAVNIVPPGARGRNSNRIISPTAYEESLMLLELAHMPEGCATWPAFWTLSEQGPWPKGGEIDIIEGASSTFFQPRLIAKLLRTQE